MQRNANAFATAPAPDLVGEHMKTSHPNDTSVKKMLSFALPVDRVRLALTESEYDWRSLAQISQETQLSMLDIAVILEEDLSEIVVRSFDRDYPDTYFYTTREHYEKIRGPWHAFLSTVCDEIR